MSHDDILLRLYCVQYVLAVFHTKHHTYINISQLRANEDSRITYDSQKRHSYIQYDHSNLIMIQDNDKDAT